MTWNLVIKLGRPFDISPVRRAGGMNIADAVLPDITEIRVPFDRKEDAYGALSEASVMVEQKPVIIQGTVLREGDDA